MLEQEKVKLLYISWTIPPTQGGSAYITHQLLKNFDKHECIAVGGSTDPFLFCNEYDGIKYHYLFSELNWKGHGDRFFVPFRILLFPLVFFQMWRIARREKVQKILATFPDGYYLFAGLLLSIVLKLPFFTYFHNTYCENRKGISAFFAKFLQRKAFKKSIRIFTMSEGMFSFYQEKYPDFNNKFEVLPHSYNELPPFEIPKQLSKFTYPVRLVFIGTINQSNLEASRRMFSVISKNASLYQLDIYSPSNKQLLKLKYGLELDVPGLKHCGVVRQEEVNAILYHYDICILTHGFTGEYNEIEYQTIFPTRTIPLLLAGRPILAHTPPHAFLTKYLKDRDCAEVVDVPEEAAILCALNRLVVDVKRIELLLNNQKLAAGYFYGPSVVAKLKQVIFKH